MTAIVPLVAVLLCGAASRHIAAGPDAKTVPDITILFFTASWCGPCRPVRIVLNEFSRTHGDRVKLIPIDFDGSKTEADRWQVHEIPYEYISSSVEEVPVRVRVNIRYAYKPGS